MEKKNNYYLVLELEDYAPISMIRQKFKELSLKYHPDKQKIASVEADEKMIEVINAYKFLLVNKQVYDHILMNNDLDHYREKLIKGEVDEELY